MMSTLLCGALAFHYFEFGVNPSVKSFGDSIWWAIVTISTIGYGDVFPVTTIGRVIAGFLMLFGLGTFGVYTASIASWVIRRE
jgi:voltage-gated potassium channel